MYDILDCFSKFCKMDICLTSSFVRSPAPFLGIIKSFREPEAEIPMDSSTVPFGNASGVAETPRGGSTSSELSESRPVPPPSPDSEAEFEFELELELRAVWPPFLFLPTRPTWDSGPSKRRCSRHEVEGGGGPLSLRLGSLGGNLAGA